MRGRAGLRPAARRISRFLPAPVRRWTFRQLAGRNIVHVAGAGRGLVSVVVLATDVEAEYLEGCLASLRAQTHAYAEIILVHCGQRASARSLARRHGAEDWRIRVVQAPGAGFAEAANLGTAKAKGQYVAFTRGTDRLPPRSLEELTGAMHDAPSDLVIGRLRQIGVVDDLLELTQRQVHAHSVRCTDLAAFPLAVSDLSVGNRMFDIDFWRRAGLAFSEEDGWTLSPTMAKALLAASSFGVVRAATYEQVRRGEGVVFGYTPDSLPGLGEWLTRTDAVLAGIDRSGSAGVRRAWLTQVLDKGLVRFLDAAERANEEQWADVMSAVDRFSALADEVVWADVRAESRTKLWLARQGDRARLCEFVASRWFEAGSHRTHIRDGEVQAEWSALDGKTDVPATCRVLAGSETPLVVSLRRARWRDDELELELFVFTRFVDMVDSAPGVEVSLVEAETGVRVDVPTRSGGSDPAVTRFAGDRHQNYDSGVAVARVSGAALVPVGLEPTSSRAARWQLRVAFQLGGVSRVGGVTHVEREGSAGHLRPAFVDGARVSPVTTDGGLTLLVERVPVVSPQDVPGVEGSEHQVGRQSRFLLEDVRLDEDTIRVVGRWRGVVPSSWSIHLVSPRGRVTGVARKVPGDAYEVELGTTWGEFGLPSTALPSGAYRLELGEEARGAAPAPLLVVGDGLVERCPVEQTGRHHAMRVRLQQSGLVVQLRAPLGDDELGTYAQERLRSQYAGADHVLDEGAVYFQSFTGESATDSQVELHEQLRRRRPDLRLYWGIADWSCAVPDGAIPVLIRSRAWYALLAEARCLIINIELERWFRSRDDQVVVQTFHGYPSKTMGIGLWQAKQFTERRIAAELSRTSDKWDVILTPAPEMDRHYREQYRYHGAIISQGYPRDDPLTGSRAPSVRAATRRRLGIRPDQKAVLYAPTWRDDLATAPRAAAMVDHLDLEAAADALGDGYVLLVRGHRFHAKVPARRGRTATVVDVTDHPEINDLMLASDAAVLDYSSLRFDYAQTGKPMIFLVPDLDPYTRGVRGFLFDFADSAPGPYVDTTAHVVEALLDLEGLSERHCDEYRRFNETYNYRQDGNVAERVADALLDTWLG